MKLPTVTNEHFHESKISARSKTETKKKKRQRLREEQLLLTQNIRNAKKPYKKTRSGEVRNTVHRGSRVNFPRSSRRLCPRFRRPFHGSLIRWVEHRLINLNGKRGKTSRCFLERSFSHLELQMRRNPIVHKDLLPNDFRVSLIFCETRFRRKSTTCVPTGSVMRLRSGWSYFCSW